MTEDEAKTKWCPFSRVVASVSADAAANRWPDTGGAWLDAKGQPHPFCVASECMAWRAQPQRWEYTEREKLAPVQGYCGLAGNP